MAYEVYKNGDGLGRERLIVWDGVGSLPTTHKGAAIDADMPAVDSSSPGDRYVFDGTQWVQTSFGGAVGVYLPSRLAGEDLDADRLMTRAVNSSYEVVGASATAQVCGTTGAVGDYLDKILITASTGTITILDDTDTVAVIPAGAVGVWPIELESQVGAWKITTAASTGCTVIGEFS